MDDSGMALWILAAIAMTALAPTLLGTAVGARAGKKRGDTGRGVRQGALVGAAVGVALVAVTFFDDALFAADVDLELPRGFAHDWVILVEDPTATRTLDWNPITRHAHVRVPRSGILRIRSLDALQGKPIRGNIEGGPPHVGYMKRTLETDRGFRLLVGFVVGSRPSPQPYWDTLDDAAVLDLVARSEREP